MIFLFFLDSDVRYALGYRGRPFGRSISVEIFWNEAQNKLVGAVHFSRNCEGPADCVHGGAIATVLDSCLGSTIQRCLGLGCFTLNLNVNYRKFVPLGAVVKIEGSVVRVEDRKVWLEAKLIGDDEKTLHADCTSIFYRAEKSADFKTTYDMIGANSGITKDMLLKKINNLKKRDKEQQQPRPKL